jgi:hypothetical protein
LEDTRKAKLYEVNVDVSYFSHKEVSKSNKFDLKAVGDQSLKDIFKHPVSVEC